MHIIYSSFELVLFEKHFKLHLCLLRFMKIFGVFIFDFNSKCVREQLLLSVIYKYYKYSVWINGYVRTNDCIPKAPCRYSI